MMFLLRMLMRKRTREMDPLHVSMTGVRMGERFLQIGCRDRALLSGLAAKVGLSGSAAVAALDSTDAKNAEAVGRKVGALIEVQNIDGSHAWPYEDAQFDMVVIDDTQDSFGGLNVERRAEILRRTMRALRSGGRIEIIARQKPNAPNHDFDHHLTDAGFKPVRVLAERDGFRFIEGLRPVEKS
jgi:ubiquinone/menaquinone biosynthesis C-methylase UbiE